MKKTTICKAIVMLIGSVLFFGAPAEAATTATLSIRGIQTQFQTVTPGQTNVTIGSIVLDAVADGPVTGQQLNMHLSGTAPQNLAQATFWDGATQVGFMPASSFAGTSDASATLRNVTITPGVSKTITMKADFVAAASAVNGGTICLNVSNASGFSGFGEDTSNGNAFVIAHTFTSFPPQAVLVSGSARPITVSANPNPATVSQMVTLSAVPTSGPAFSSSAVYSFSGDDNVSVSGTSNSTIHLYSFQGPMNLTVVVNDAGSVSTGSLTVNVMSTVTLDSISIVQAATKTYFQVGDSLSYASLIVAGHYSDGTVQNIPTAQLAVTGFDSAAANPSELLTVSYGGKTTTYTVSIQSPLTVVTLSSLSITTPALKTNYQIGDALSITNLVVTGTYSDNSTQVEPIVAANVTGFSSAAANPSELLTVSYGGKTTTYTVSITTPALKTNYQIGDALSITNLVVTGTYSDNSTQVEPIVAANVTGFSSAAANPSELLTVSVTNGGVTKSVTYTVVILPAGTVPPINPAQITNLTALKNPQAVFTGQLNTWQFVSDKGGSYGVDWGDNTSPVMNSPVGLFTHDYTGTGTYNPQFIFTAPDGSLTTLQEAVTVTTPGTPGTVNLTDVVGSFTVHANGGVDVTNVGPNGGWFFKLTERQITQIGGKKKPTIQIQGALQTPKQKTLGQFLSTKITVQK